jgi:hypothetical protein
MTFIADPENGRRVFDPVSGYALTKVFRDVPKSDAWFDFFYEGVTFLVKSNVTWSDNRNKCVYSLEVSQIENSVRQSPSRRKLGRVIESQEFRSSVLPALRDAIVSQAIRTRGDPRIVRDPLEVVVDFNV